MTENTYRVRVEKTNAQSIGFMSTSNVNVFNAGGTGNILLSKVVQTLDPLETYQLSGIKKFVANRLLAALTFGTRMLYERFGIESRFILANEE